ncbi:restriction endonuclease subunit S [Saccharicrinis sp. FJH2]|uniref:restriction endonuclease subunit S n=1 Tax=Saccharicrinis sp. FJH65 TaxID=3344659 RepID=UPI0035F2807D
MDVNLNKLNIDKSNWTLVKFGDVAKEPKENVKDIHAEGIEHVVGLEHIDSEDIHLRRSANLESSTTFTKKFRTGDVLFGRRRAYLKKAAQAPFSGICSGDITVFRAKDSILPELLPFVVYNDKFFDYAVKHSAGGLSPRVKFKDLANYKVLLPPKDHQEKLAELLWAMDDVIEKEKEVYNKLVFQSQVYLNKSFRYGAFLNQKSKESKYGLIPESWELKTLNDLGVFKNGINKDKNDFGFGNPFVNLLDIFGNKEIGNREFGKVNVTASELKQFDLKKGDILFVRSSVKPSGVGLTTLVIEDLPDTVYSGFIIRFRPLNNSLNHLYKKYCFYEERFRYSLLRRSTISANTNINQESLNKLMIPLPPDTEQEEFSRIMNRFERIQLQVESKIASSKALQRSLINQIF